MYAVICLFYVATEKITQVTEQRTLSEPLLFDQSQASGGHFRHLFGVVVLHSMYCIHFMNPMLKMQNS